MNSGIHANPALTRLEPLQNRQLRILITDDFEPWAHLLQSLLADIPQFHVVGIGYDSQTLLQNARELNPDLILLDINLAHVCGIDLLLTLRDYDVTAKVIFVSQNTSASVIAAAFEAGAHGYVLKTDASQELVSAIETAQEGGRYLSRSLRSLFPEI
jgi:DNA-binding NarL/FixJ family response regulator